MRGRTLLIVLVGIAAGCRRESEPPAPPAPAPSTAPSPAASPEPAKEAGPAEPPREAGRAEAEAMLAALEREVAPGASEHAFPWALAHGLVGFGAALKTDRGQLAIDALAAHAVPETVFGREVYRFPARTASGLPVEPHRDMVVLSLLSADVPLDRSLSMADGTQRTLAELVADAAWSFQMPTDEAGFRDFGWSASVFSEPNVPLEHPNGPLDRGTLAVAAMAALESEQAFLAELMRKNAPERVQKRKQHIFAHGCGGFHFIQGVLALAATSGDPSLLRRARAQLDIVKFRWEAEREIYRRALEQHPAYTAQLSVQQLKFFGHALETFALAAKRGALVPSEADRRFVRRVVADLGSTIEALRPVFGAAEQLRAASPQTYFDLIGDGCHAMRGLRVGLPIFFPRDGTPATEGPQ